MSDQDGQEESSFKEATIKGKLALFSGIILLVGLVIGFIATILFFGFVGVFKIIGVTYESNSSLFIFVIIFFIIGFFVDIFFEALAKLTSIYINNKIGALFIEIIFSFTSNWIVLFTVDYLMKSITLSVESKLVIALLFALVEAAFNSKSGKSKS